MIPFDKKLNPWNKLNPNPIGDIPIVFYGIGRGTKLVLSVNPIHASCDLLQMHLRYLTVAHYCLAKKEYKVEITMTHNYSTHEMS